VDAFSIFDHHLSLRTNQHAYRPFNEFNIFVSDEFLSLRIVEVQGLGRLFVAVGLQKVLDLRGNGVELPSELLLAGLIHFGCNVATQVVQVIECEQHRSAGGRGSDGVRKLFVDIHGIFKNELSLLDR
jgi:hypothetical protein